MFVYEPVGDDYTQVFDDDIVIEGGDHFSDGENYAVVRHVPAAFQSVPEGTMIGFAVNSVGAGTAGTGLKMFIAYEQDSSPIQAEGHTWR